MEAAPVEVTDVFEDRAVEADRPGEGGSGEIGPAPKAARTKDARSENSTSDRFQPSANRARSKAAGPSLTGPGTPACSAMRRRGSSPWSKVVPRRSTGAPGDSVPR